MAHETLKGTGTDIKVWTQIDGIEKQAKDQLLNIAALPWVVHVAVMPDVHFGKGATVGSVIGMRGAVSPAAVGVDIGCGMGAVRTDLRASDLPSDLSPIRAEIERLIPVGFNAHEPGSTGMLPADLALEMARLFEEFKDLSAYLMLDEKRMVTQCGTLGGGNHFIELCLDDGTCECEMAGGPGRQECVDCGYTGKREPYVYMMLHSGSRNVGKTLAEYHMEKAKKLIHNVDLPDPDLAVFLKSTPEMAAYRHDLFWTQRYAMLNRRVMFALYEQALRKFFPKLYTFEPVLCHHNYVAEEVHFGEELVVTRKGAIRAGRGELGIIPGSMGTKSYIVQGKGNVDSLSSASHGAGRRMSRNAAKKKFTQADLIEQTKGVECRKDVDVVDEIPAAYKDIDEVMRNQDDLVSVKAVLKQVLCVKG